MSSDAFIGGVEYYLPEKVLSNTQINSEHPEWSADKISAKTGIYNRHIASEKEFSSDLGFRAAQKIFETNTISKSEIDYLVFCTQSPDYLVPTTACILQDKLGLSNHIGAIDINMGCSGYLYGLSYASGLVCSGQAKNVLLITSETYSKYINPLDKNNKTIFGDGASATIISESGIGGLKGAIRNFSFYTDGSGFDKLIVRNSGVRNSNEPSLNIFDEEGNYIKNDSNLYMNGKAIFEFTSFKVPQLIDSFLSKNKITMQSIDLFVFHQANEYMMQFIRRRCKIAEEKFFIYLKDCGNTVSSSIPIALNEAMKQQRIKNGSKVLLVGFGVGLSIAVTLIDYLDD